MASRHCQSQLFLVHFQFFIYCLIDVLIKISAWVWSEFIKVQYGPPHIHSIHEQWFPNIQFLSDHFQTLNECEIQPKFEFGFIMIQDGHHTHCLTKLTRLSEASRVNYPSMWGTMLPGYLSFFIHVYTTLICQVLKKFWPYSFELSSIKKSEELIIYWKWTYSKTPFIRVPFNHEWV
jgi:hypothetical protein